jgi:hypothetical protein
MIEVANAISRPSGGRITMESFGRRTQRRILFDTTLERWKCGYEYDPRLTSVRLFRLHPERRCAAPNPRNAANQYKYVVNIL